MILELHPDIALRRLVIGRERAPLLVIDNLIADADRLVRKAASKHFAASTRFFPGTRVEAPLSYQELVASCLKDTLLDFFQLEGRSFRFSMCHYSLVTTPPAQLTAIQRIPHIDSLGRDGLASIHYLFKRNLGGTAFYRHRKTGFESIDESRREIYFRSLESENDGADMPAAEYINGDTALFEQIAKQDGVFNRMLIYRRNSLHSGCIDRNFVPDASPLTGRLSINSFLDPQL